MQASSRNVPDMGLEFHLEHSVLGFCSDKANTTYVFLYIHMKFAAFAFQGTYKNYLAFVKGFLVGHFIAHMKATTPIAAQIGKTMY